MSKVIVEWEMREAQLTSLCRILKGLLNVSRYHGSHCMAGGEI